MGRPQKQLDSAVLDFMYWNKGMSVLQISRELEVSYETVRKRMEVLNIPRRPSGPSKLDPNRVECDNGHPLDDTNRYVSSSGRVTCRICRNAHSRKVYFTSHKKCLDRARRYSRLKRFGMTKKDYEQKAISQKLVCAICGQPETEIAKSGNAKTLAVDHDHKTGKVRDLLCGRCNRVLGFLNEDTKLLERMAGYLQRHSDSQ